MSTPEEQLNSQSAQMTLPEFIDRAGDKLGVPKILRDSIFERESGFQHYSAPGVVKRSPAGALGVGQLMPDTARRLNVNINDPLDNAYGGLKEQKRLYDKYLEATGSQNTAMLLTAAAYNSGEGNVEKYHGIPPFAETQNYVRYVASRIRGAEPEKASQESVDWMDPTSVQSHVENLAGLSTPDTSVPREPSSQTPAITTSDLEWHLGIPAQQAEGWFKGLSAKKQTQVITAVSKATANDEIKKARGDELTIDPSYQATMRKRLGVNAPVKPSASPLSVPTEPIQLAGGAQKLREMFSMRPDNGDALWKQVHQQVLDEEIRLRREIASDPLHGQNIALKPRSPEEINAEVERRIAEQPSAAEKALAQPQIEAMEGQNWFQRQWERGTPEIASFVHKAQATLGRDLSKVLPGGVSARLKTFADQSQSQARVDELVARHEYSGDQTLLRGIGKQVVEQAFSLTPLIASEAATGIPFPILMAGQSYLENGDKPAGERLTKAGTAYVLGRAYQTLPGMGVKALQSVPGQVGRLALVHPDIASRVVGAGGFGLYGGGETLAAGGTPKQALIAGVAQAVPGAVLAGSPEKLRVPEEPAFQSVPADVQGKLVNAEMERTLAAREAGVAPTLTPEELSRRATSGATVVRATEPQDIAFRGLSDDALLDHITTLSQRPKKGTTKQRRVQIPLERAAAIAEYQRRQAVTGQPVSGETLPAGVPTEPDIPSFKEFVEQYPGGGVRFDTLDPNDPLFKERADQYVQLYGRKEGQTNAISQGQQQSNNQTELQGVRGGQNVPAYGGEVRQETGGLPVGSRSAETSGQVEGQVSSPYRLIPVADGSFRISIAGPHGRYSFENFPNRAQAETRLAELQSKIPTVPTEPAASQAALVTPEGAAQVTAPTPEQGVSTPPAVEQAAEGAKPTPLAHAIELVKSGATPEAVVQSLKDNYGTVGQKAINLDQQARDSLKPKVVTPQVPSEPQTSLVDQVSALVDERGNLTRGGDHVNVLMKGRSDAEVRDLLQWARTQGPNVQRFVGANAIAELRSRGIDAKDIPMPISSEPASTPLKTLSTGSDSTATGERGTKISTKYAIVEAKDLTVSHDQNLEPNPNFPSELQPRDRGRAASETQVNQIASNPRPEWLAESSRLSEGSPIVAPADGVVESGNGRVLGLRKAYEYGNADNYRQYLLDNAEKFGLDPKAIRDAKEPVLVRLRQSEVDRPAFVREANESSVASMSAPEQAKSDAGRLTGALLSTFQPSESGEINTAANARFIQAFMHDVVGPNELGRYVGSKGEISQEGLTRIRNAIFARAYGDSPEGLRALEKIAESPDNNVRNITNALLQRAGQFAALKEGIEKGDRYPVDITTDLTKALAKLSTLREQDTTVADYLNQQGLFEEDLTPLQKQALQVFDEHKRSAKAISAILDNYAKGAEAAGSPNQGSFFEKTAPDKGALFEAAVKEALRDANKEVGLFESEGIQPQPETSSRVPNVDTAGQRPSVPEPNQSPTLGFAGIPTEPGSSGATGSQGGSLNFGPGAANVGDRPMDATIDQLTAALNAMPKTAPVDQVQSIGQKVAAKLSAGADAITNAFMRAKASGQGLFAAYKNSIPTVTTFERALGRWVAALQHVAASSDNFATATRKQIPDELTRRAIQKWIEADGDPEVLQQRANDSTRPQYKAAYERALILTDEQQTFARNVQSYYDAKLQEGLSEGILSSQVENYINHVYNKPNPVTGKLLSEMGGQLQSNFRFARQRFHATTFEAEQTGLDPVDDVAKLIPIYDMNFGRTVAGRGMIREMMAGKAPDGRSIFAIAGSGGGPTEVDGADPDAAVFVRAKTKPKDARDYVLIDHPALKGWKWVGNTPEVWNPERAGEIAGTEQLGGGQPIVLEGPLLVHPEYAAHLRNALGRSSLRDYAAWRGVMQIQSAIKQGAFGLSGFHQTTEGLHALSRQVVPAYMPDIDMNDPVTKLGMEAGLLLHETRSREEFSEALGNIWQHVPVIGKQVADRYQQYLFQDYIPRLKLATYNVALEQNLGRYADDITNGKITPEQIRFLTASQVNADYGGLNYRLMGRNPTTQDVARAFLIAPDFLESRVRFVAQATRPYGMGQLKALGLMAFSQYVGARILNQLIDRDPHWAPEDAFALVVGKRRYELRTIPGDVLKGIYHPAQFIGARLSPTVQFGVEVKSGVNYFGEKVTFPQAVEDLGLSALPTWARSRNGETYWQAALRSVGVQSRQYKSPAEQGLNEAIAPFLPQEPATGPRADLRKEVLTKERAGESARVELQQGKQEGVINQKDIQRMVKAGKMTPMQAKVEALDRDAGVSGVLDWYENYGSYLTPEEQTGVKSILRRSKINMATHPENLRGTLADKMALKTRLNKALGVVTVPTAP